MLKQSPFHRWLSEFEMPIGTQIAQPMTSRVRVKFHYRIFNRTPCNERENQMISQKTLLRELAEEFEQASILGLEDIQVLSGRGMITARLPMMCGSRERFLVAVIREENFQVRVHNLSFAHPPFAAENVMTKHFLNLGPDHTTDSQGQRLLGLHVANVLAAPRSPGDLVQLLAMSTNERFIHSRACHDPNDGELFVKVDIRIEDGIPEDLRVRLVELITQATMIISFAELVDSVTTVSSGVPLPVEEQESDEVETSPESDDESESEELWL